MANTSDSDDLTKPTLADEIRHAIQRGEYGPGQRLIEGDICKRFNASRFVVRAALQELAGHGLIDFTYNRGARVHEVSVREALQIMEVREQLVGIVAARAAELADADTIERFRQLVVEMRNALANDDLASYRVMSRDFQQLLQKTSEHEVATELLGRLHDRTARYAYTLSMLRNGSRASVPHYEAIAEAIAAHDPEQASVAARGHLAAMVAALREWATQFSDERMETDQAGVAFAPELTFRG